MEKPIYQSAVDFYYFNQGEGFSVPKGTIFYSQIFCDTEYTGIHYNLVKPITIPSSFFDENNIIPFNKINHETLNQFIIFIEAIRLLKNSRMNKEEMIDKLSEALGFLAFSDTDFEDINTESEENECIIGKPPVTAYTWSSTGAHSSFKYD